MSARTRTASRSDLGRLALAALLGAMAVGQLSNPSGFFGILETYRVGGASTATAIAIALIAGELAAATGLLSSTRSRRHMGAEAALIVALAWSVLGLQAFARGLHLESCGCFGVHLSQPLRWWVLLEDIELIAFAWWVRARAARPSASGADREMVGSAIRP